MLLPYLKYTIFHIT